MRMRNRDPLQPAERADIGYRFVGRERNAVPHHATIRLAQQQGTLADGKGRLEPEAGNAEVVTPDHPMRLRQLLARQPALALPVHELPLVLADRAGRRWRYVFRKLRTALLTGPKGHLPLQSDTCWQSCAWGQVMQAGGTNPIGPGCTFTSKGQRAAGLSS